MQAGALFTEGQNNSLGAIMASQFSMTGVGGGAFVQPNINASLGWNLFVTQPFLTDNSKPILGRMLLQYANNKSCLTGEPTPLPTMQAYAPGVLEALPNPAANSGFIYTGGAINNFSVPAVTVGQTLSSATGNWSNPNPAVGFSPFYARFASVPGTSTIISDASTAQGTFVLVWLGLDDFFLYAAYGGDPNYAPLTSSSDFTTRLGAVFGHPSIGLFTTSTTSKGVIGNFPDIFKMPHFTSVSYNPIPLKEAEVAQLNTGFGGYNAALDGLIANKAAFGISDALASEIATRKVSFSISCNNKILLIDETLTNLAPYFDALKGAGAITAQQRAGLVPYERVRQSTSSDVIPLATGAVLGLPGTFGLLGVSEPVGDRWVIVPAEKAEINAARIAYNATVAGIASAYTARLALADVDAAIEGLINAKVGVYNGVTITPNINPPTGMYSEDGVHPNSRGYAFLSRVFIQAINTKFGATIPLTDLSKYKATALPIP